MSEYTQDRLNKRIRELEAEVLSMHKKLMVYQEMEHNRKMVEAALFAFGFILGAIGGVYAI